MTPEPPKPEPLKAVLLDIDGTVRQKGAPIPGAVETLQFLSDRGLRVCFLTNTTLRSSAEVASGLAALTKGGSGDFLMPALAARNILAARGLKRVALFGAPCLQKDLAAFEIDQDNPEAAILGDVSGPTLGDQLDAVLALLMRGIPCLALHGNLIGARGDGVGLDLGAFVVALERASGKNLEIVGKPSPLFFQEALRVVGAARLGLHAFAVRTGKYEASGPHPDAIAPERVLASIADLPAALEEMGLLA